MVEMEAQVYPKSKGLWSFSPFPTFDSQEAGAGEAGQKGSGVSGSESEPGNRSGVSGGGSSSSSSDRTGEYPPLHTGGSRMNVYQDFAQ